MKRKRSVRAIMDDFDKYMQNLCEKAESAKTVKERRKIIIEADKNLKESPLWDELGDIKLGPERMGEPIFYREKK